MSRAEATALAAPDLAHRPRRSARAWQRGLIGAAVVFGLVEAITRAGLVNASYLPPASSVLRVRP